MYWALREGLNLGGAQPCGTCTLLASTLLNRLMDYDTNVSV